MPLQVKDEAELLALLPAHFRSVAKKQLAASQANPRAAAIFVSTGLATGFFLEATFILGVAFLAGLFVTAAFFFTAAFFAAGLGFVAFLPFVLACRPTLEAFFTAAFFAGPFFKAFFADFFLAIAVPDNFDDEHGGLMKAKASIIVLKQSDKCRRAFDRSAAGVDVGLTSLSQVENERLDFGDCSSRRRDPLTR